MPFNKESRFLTIVSVPNENGKSWRVGEDFYYYDKPLNVYVLVLKHSSSDLASIPSAFKWLVSNDDYRVRKPALIHDEMYNREGRLRGFFWLDKYHYAVKITRKHADDIFYRALVEEGLSKFKARLMWLAVRLFGRWDD